MRGFIFVLVMYSVLFGDSLNVSLLGRVREPAFGVCVNRDYYSLIGDIDKIRVVDVIDPLHPVVVGQCDFDISTFGYPTDIFVFEDYAFVSNGSFQIIRVFDPTHPTRVVCLNEVGAMSVWVVDSYAYVADWRVGLRILDVSVPGTPRMVGLYNLDGGVQDICVKENYAYVAAGRGGLWIIDVSDPTDPVEVGFCDVVANKVCVSDSYAYVGNGGIHVIDISDPASPCIVGEYHIPGWVDGLAVEGSYLYAISMMRFYVLDASDPHDLCEVGFYDVGGFVSDVCVLDFQAYVATGDSGLYILDVSDVSRVEGLSSREPKNILLSVYPNPFNSSATIEVSDNCNVIIYDLRGDIVSKFTVRGIKKVKWTPSSDVPSGIYLVKAMSGIHNFASKEIVYIK